HRAWRRRRAAARTPLDSTPMCGIIAVERSPSVRTAPAADAITRPLHYAVAALAGDRPLAETCHEAASLVESADALLHGATGVHALVHDRRLLAEVEGTCATLSEVLRSSEARLDA